MKRMRPKFLFLLGLIISFALHIALFFLVKPLINAKATPVITSWLDILSLRDLTTADRKKQPLDNKLLLPPKDKNYFLSFLDKERIFVAADTRDFYSPSPLRISFRKNEMQSVIFQKQIVPLLELFEGQTGHLRYKTCVTPRGRILLVIPLTLPFDSFTPMYIEDQVKESAVFLGREDFYWTRVEVMIE